MKRFLLFGHAFYDAKGGFMDILGEFDSEKEARDFVRGHPNDGWWHIIDLETRKMVDSRGRTSKIPLDEKHGRRTVSETMAG